MFKRDTEALNLKEVDTEDMTTLARSIKGVEMVMFFKEMAPETFRVSLRSKGSANAARVAEHFGGGGHIHASGFTVYGPYERLIREVPATVEGLLDAAAGGPSGTGPLTGEAVANDGLLVIDKPGGLTSHDVVQRVRKLLGTRRVGHGGTLDPDATGVLLVAVGQATRFFPFLSKENKVYEGLIRLGFATDTYDASGRPAAGDPAPSCPEGTRSRRP